MLPQLSAPTIVKSSAILSIIIALILRAALPERQIAFWGGMGQNSAHVLRF
jgi:hypothetical protein